VRPPGIGVGSGPGRRLLEAGEGEDDAGEADEVVQSVKIESIDCETMADE
jgi:hypothetical protein